MKRNILGLRLVLGRLDGRHVRLGLAVLTLALFVLGAGAPGAPGGSGG
jgi:hypothetical protein